MIGYVSNAVRGTFWIWVMKIYLLTGLTWSSSIFDSLEVMEVKLPKVACFFLAAMGWGLANPHLCLHLPLCLKLWHHHLHHLGGERAEAQDSVSSDLDGGSCTRGQFIPKWCSLALCPVFYALYLFSLCHVFSLFTWDRPTCKEM